MPHTPLLRNLRQLMSNAAEASTTAKPVDDVFQRRHLADISRRQFLQRTAIAGAAMMSGPLLRAAKPAGSNARVVVVGAGLAGLTCAYRLMQAGVDATIHEANTRLGGRCWTRRGDFMEGQMAEHGGELIDQGHTKTRQLAQELRLPLDNLLAAQPNGTESLYSFYGSYYSYRDATADLKGIWKKLHRDLSEASYPTLYNLSTPRGRQLDQMSIIDWINESVP